MDQCIYNIEQVSKMLGVTIYTVRNWYMWQNKLIKSGEVEKKYLPIPEKQIHAKGKPSMWSLEMIDDLRMYQKDIVRGRNGNYGKFTNQKAKLDKSRQ